MSPPSGQISSGRTYTLGFGRKFGPGITFSGQVSNVSGSPAGQVQVWQTCDATYVNATSNGYDVVSSYGNNVLDSDAVSLETAKPIITGVTSDFTKGDPIPIKDSDCPTQLFYTNNATSSLSSMVLSGQFQTYLMYKPQGAHSIFVVLKRVNWEIYATATVNNGQLLLDKGSMFTENPKGVHDPNLPQWNGHMQEINSSELSTKVSGSVKDAQGRPLAGIRVTAFWIDDGETEQLFGYTNSNGQYAIYGDFGLNPVVLTTSDAQTYAQGFISNGQDQTINFQES